MTTTGVAVLAGVGPRNGLGGALVERCARDGLTVVAAGRDGARLQATLDAIAADLPSGAGALHAVPTDVTEPDAVTALFDAASSHGRLALAVYNAGNNTPGKVLDLTADYFEHAWRVGCFGGFLFGQAALRALLDRQPDSRGKRGTLVFTGASASLRGRAGFGAFNAAKGALRNLAMAMAKEHGADGIHVCHVVVDGAIHGDKIVEAVPEYAERLGAAGMLSLDALADAYASLHAQGPGGWSFELDLRTALERW